MTKLTLKKAREIARKVCGCGKVVKGHMIPTNYEVQLQNIVVQIGGICDSYDGRPLVEVVIWVPVAYDSIHLYYWADTLERCYKAEDDQEKRKQQEIRESLTQQLQERGLIRDA